MGPRDSDRTDNNNREREIPTWGPSCRLQRPLPTAAAASPANHSSLSNNKHILIPELYRGQSPDIFLCAPDP